MIVCPLCGAQLDFEADEIEEGDTISCFDCDTELEVVSTDPVQLVSSSGKIEEADRDEADGLKKDDAGLDDLE